MRTLLLAVMVVSVGCTGGDPIVDGGAGGGGGGGGSGGGSTNVSTCDGGPLCEVEPNNSCALTQLNNVDYPFERHGNVALNDVDCFLPGNGVSRGEFMRLTVDAQGTLLAPALDIMESDMGTVFRSAGGTVGGKLVFEHLITTSGFHYSVSVSGMGGGPQSNYVLKGELFTPVPTIVAIPSSTTGVLPSPYEMKVYGFTLSPGQTVNVVATGAKVRVLDTATKAIVGPGPMTLDGGSQMDAGTYLMIVESDSSTPANLGFTLNVMQ